VPIRKMVSGKRSPIEEFEKVSRTTGKGGASTSKKKERAANLRTPLGGELITEVQSNSGGISMKEGYACLGTACLKWPLSSGKEFSYWKGEKNGRRISWGEALRLNHLLMGRYYKKMGSYLKDSAVFSFPEENSSRM